MRWLGKYADDLLILAGCGMLLYGTYQVSPLAIWFVGGVMLCGFGIAIGKSEANR